MRFSMRWFSCWFRRPRLTNISATFRRLRAWSVATRIAVPCTELKASTNEPISSSVSFLIGRIWGSTSSAPTRRSSATARGRRRSVTDSASSIRRVNGPTMEREITKTSTARRKAASAASKVKSDRWLLVSDVRKLTSLAKNCEPCWAASFHSPRLSHRRSNTSAEPMSGVTPSERSANTMVLRARSWPAFEEAVGAW